jgi:DNA-binding IclR family transcriptional regulator
VLAAQSLRGSRLLHAALPVIESLMDTGLTVALGVLWRDKVCYLFHGRNLSGLASGIAGHHLYPAEQSSIGAVLSNDDAIRARGYALLRPKTTAASLSVAIGTPAYAGLALTGTIADADVEGLVIRLRAAAERIATTTAARPT